MRNSIVSIACSAAVLLTGCSEPSTSLGPAFEPLAVPAKGHVTSPRLASDIDGKLILSWLAPGPAGTALQFSRFYRDNWSPVTTVVENVEMFVNWADLPSVVPVGGNRLAAHWLVKRPGNVYSYDVAFAQSSDNGFSWSSAIAPHDDGTPTEHGFVSIFPHEEKVGLIWLDGRNMANEHDKSNPGATGMTLRAGFVDNEQALHGEQLVDALTCECCQTDVAIAASGPIAAYRDRTVEEVRDISVARFVDGAWGSGQIIAEDNWTISACPVNGPSIVAGGRYVAVAWFTGAVEPVIRLSTSSDNGETFREAIDVVVGNTLGRVGLALLDSGDVAVSWLRTGANDNTEVLVRHVARNGSIGPILTVSTAAASLAVPQMVRLKESLIFAWTRTEDGEHRVSSAKVPIEALYARP